MGDECRDVEKTHAKQVAYQECNDVPEQKCVSVPKQTCVTVPDQICKTKPLSITKHLPQCRISSTPVSPPSPHRLCPRSLTPETSRSSRVRRRTIGLSLRES